MSEWIDVDLKKPPTGVEILICTEWLFVTTSHYFDKGYAEGFNDFDGDVTHWMPLPEPPK